jgi:phosphoribosylformimino-5-aminoimidazole carboxamide ribotide isomerase
MRTFKFIGTALFAIFICASLTSCGGENDNKVKEGQKALDAAVKKHGGKIAVGVDIKDGMVAIKGWTEVSGVSCDEMFASLQDIGVDCVICTDISKDGMMSGTNIELYRELSEKYSIKLIASGGVSTLDDIKTLNEMNVFGAIVGKAIYTGAVDLGEALSICGEENR